MTMEVTGGRLWSQSVLRGQFLDKIDAFSNAARELISAASLVESEAGGLGYITRVQMATFADYGDRGVVTLHIGDDACLDGVYLRASGTKKAAE